MPTPYVEKFPAGARVRIKGELELQRFAREWKYHNPLAPEQLPFAGFTATVEEVGFYHGGDPIYRLAEIPGVWHEECLEAG
jgi:hypothetical protein